MTASATSAGPAATGPAPTGPAPTALGVLANRRFLALWLAQVSTQIGGNMVLYGLTILVYGSTNSNSAVSALLLTFLVPAVVLSAVAGVFVDRFDRRLILISTNVLRGVGFVAMVISGHGLLAIYVLNILVSILTTLFAPTEASMIPMLVEREQLMQANGLFTFTLNASFAVGFALFGPLVVNLAGTDALLILVAICYLLAAALCMTLPSARPTALTGGASALAFGEAERAVAGTFRQLRDGLEYIRANPSIFWSLSYLAIVASLIGVVGVLGPGFATKALGLRETDFVVVVLPLAVGLVLGVLLLNVYGRYLPRQRVIQGGLIGLSVTLGILSVAGPLSRFLQRHAAETSLVDLQSVVSLLSIVVALALLAGISYAAVAIPAQTQLQEELPSDVRGRVFGVLNMLVSVASFLPIIVVGPVADLVGTPVVLLICAVGVGVAGVGSVLAVHPVASVAATPTGHIAPVDPVAVTAVPLEGMPALEVPPSDGPRPRRAVRARSAARSLLQGAEMRRRSRSRSASPPPGTEEGASGDVEQPAAGGGQPSQPRGGQPSQPRGSQPSEPHGGESSEPSGSQPSERSGGEPPHPRSRKKGDRE